MTFGFHGGLAAVLAKLAPKPAADEPQIPRKSRAQLLYDIGSILRDPDDGFGAKASDPIDIPGTSRPVAGGGVGGVGGAGRRRAGRRTP